MVNGKRSAEIWSGSSSSLTEKQAKAIIVPVRSGNYLALTGSMAALTFVVVAHESLKWMVWTLGPSEAALCHPGGFDLPLAVEGTVPKKIWNMNPFLSSCPKGKKKIPDEFVQVLPILKREIQVWWTEYPGVSLALQEVETWLHKEWLKVSYLKFYL